MDTEAIKNLIIDTLDEKKGGDIQVLDLKDKTSVADFFIIATGRNNIQVTTLAEVVMEKLEDVGIDAVRNEGVKDGRWAIIDYGNILVHIFNADTRDFFCLEKLWKS